MSTVVELLADLIAIPSVNPGSASSTDPPGAEAEVTNYIEDRLAKKGIACQRQPVTDGRDNLIAVIEGRSEQAVMLESHTDTVGTANMTIAPFTPVVKNGRMYGRGACDTKGCVAAMLATMERIADSGTPQQTCVWAATVDEEYLFQGIEKLVEEGLPARVIGAAVGEPTQLDVIIRHRGRVWLEVTAFGKAVHSSHPQEGDNSIYHITRLIQAFEQYATGLGKNRAAPGIGTPTCAVTVVRGGEVINIVPDRCLLRLDRRVLPTERPAQVLAELENVARQTAGTDFSYDTEAILLDPPLDLPPDTPFVGRCQAAVEAVRGRARVGGVAYSTHASRLAEAGIPALVLGPGDAAAAHTADEWIEIAQVEQAVEVYYRLCCG